MAENYKIFALKRVNLEDVDRVTLAGYKGEIDLLKKLENVERVVRLFDWEINSDKHTLSILMEIGESDLDRILTYRLNAEDAVFDPSFTRYYWKEMLECVQAVHNFNIVHSDLKPANFLLVQGRLKLIDFGIANAIQDDTVNVHREQQVGTPNYMSPEALIDSNAALGLPASVGKMMKLGKPSDVWSLGCILYKMVYGQPPFARIAKYYERIMSIPNPKVAIEFPQFAIGGVTVPFGLMRTMKRCLQRDPSLRPTMEELLSERDPFLYPDSQLEGTVPVTQEMISRILTNVVHHCRVRGVPKDEELAAWPAGFFAKIKAAVDEDQK
jgi:serine/threonine-protein kinase TTK/MPS1